MVIGWERLSTRNGFQPGRAAAICSAEANERRAREKDDDFRAKSSIAEFLVRLGSRDKERGCDNRNRKEGDYREEGGSVELEVAINGPCPRSEGIEALHCSRNYNSERETD